MAIRSAFAGLLALAAFGIPDSVAARSWSDAKGTRSVRAELVSAGSGKAVLIKQDGQQVEVPVERLSDDDREYIDEWLQHQTELKPLLARLASDRDDDRLAALRELIDLGGEEAAPAVPKLTELLAAENASIRQHAAQALAEIGGPAAPAFESLLGLVRKGGDDLLPAMRALEEIGDAALPRFVAAMADDNAMVSEIAADIVGAEGESMRPIILPLLDDKRPQLRLAGLIAFLKSKPPADELLQQCRRALGDKSPAVRMRACDGLSLLHDEALPALPQLIALAASDTEPLDVRRVAIVALDEIAPEDPRVLPAAIAYLKLKDNYTIGNSLMHHIGAAAVAPVTKLLDDKDAKTRLFAATALKNISASRSSAVPALQRMCVDSDPFIRHASVQVFGTMGPEAQAVETDLVKLLGDDNADVRLEALRALARAGLPPQKIVPLLQTALTDESTSVQGEAALALGTLGPVAAAALPALRQRLTSKEGWVVKKSKQAIQRIAAPIDSSLQAHDGPIVALAFAPDGKSLISAGPLADGSTSFITWNIATRRRGAVIPVESRHYPCVAMSRSGGHIAAKQHLFVATLYDATTGKRTRRLKGHTGSLNSLAFSLDGAQLVSSSDEMIRVWDVATGDAVSVVEPEISVEIATFLSDGKRLAAAGDGVQILNVADGEVLHSLEGQEDYPQCLVASPDGQWVACGGDDGGVYIWDAETGELLHEIAAHDGGVLCLAASFDGQRIVTGGDDGLVHVWSIESGEKLQSLAGEESPIHAVAFSADGRRIAAGDKTGYVRIWSPK